MLVDIKARCTKVNKRYTYVHKHMGHLKGFSEPDHIEVVLRTRKVSILRTGGALKSLLRYTTTTASSSLAHVPTTTARNLKGYLLRTLLRTPYSVPIYDKATLRRELYLLDRCFPLMVTMSHFSAAVTPGRSVGFLSMLNFH